MPHCQYAYTSPCLVSDSYHIIFMIHSTHVSLQPHQITFTAKNSTRENWGSVPGLLTTYKTHAMATHHGGTGCPLDRGLDILIEDPEHADFDNDRTHSLDATVAQKQYGTLKIQNMMTRTD